MISFDSLNAKSDAICPLNHAYTHLHSHIHIHTSTSKFRKAITIARTNGQSPDDIADWKSCAPNSRLNQITRKSKSADRNSQYCARQFRYYTYADSNSSTTNFSFHQSISSPWKISWWNVGCRLSLRHGCPENYRARDTNNFTKAIARYIEFANAPLRIVDMALNVQLTARTRFFHRRREYGQSACTETRRSRGMTVNETRNRGSEPNESSVKVSRSPAALHSCAAKTR